ncbi:TerB family tellurite resistance protein [Parahaliea mediterranea]|uniref:TerB family tellurite resistance protein n=1 Tax=Parahaliea mediterranea TaxID=651086 RepID=A0A939DFQ0_9GAMM|nr:TerB family tellurite resistance protein [Parahaliea mediterranea]MBN7796677.1 TerB family tellurite resistance protein [Parahaliea mediterranea]
MIRALKALFETPEQDSPEQLEHRLRLAAAALLVETGRADFGVDPRERQTMAALLCEALNLPEAEVNALIVEAEARAGEATSLYEFTRLINDHYSPRRKVQLIAHMWQVAYADGNLDKYEEALIRQVAELIYVPHRDYIQAKLAAGKPAT